MNVSLRPLQDRDLDPIYQQVSDPESVRMAAFTAEDQTDRRAFLNRVSRLRADSSVSYRVIEVDGAVAGTIASLRFPDVVAYPERGVAWVATRDPERPVPEGGDEGVVARFDLPRGA